MKEGERESEDKDFAEQLEELMDRGKGDAAITEHLWLIRQYGRGDVGGAGYKAALQGKTTAMTNKFELPEPEYKPTIAVDFDGVIHSYTSPWTRAEEINDPPTAGALQAINTYVEAGFTVVVFSARAKKKTGHKAIWAWLKEHGFPSMCIVTEKPHAVIYIDDRGYHFEGYFPTVEFIKNFKPWNKQ